jgi:hypothetical protein
LVQGWPHQECTQSGPRRLHNKRLPALKSMGGFFPKNPFSPMGKLCAILVGQRSHFPFFAEYGKCGRAGITHSASRIQPCTIEHLYTRYYEQGSVCFFLASSRGRILLTAMLTATPTNVGEELRTRANRVRLVEAAEGPGRRRRTSKTNSACAQKYEVNSSLTIDGYT